MPPAHDPVDDLDTLATASALAPGDPPQPAGPSGTGACANCGETLQGAYCAGCGQADEPLRKPVHRFLIDSFIEFLGIDGRVWRTLGVLLFKPGKLTAEYLQGRRRRYLRPLRVYLSSTLLFFVLLSIIDPVGRARESLFGNSFDERDSVLVADQLARADSIAGLGLDVLDDERADIAELRALIDSAAALQDPDAVDDMMEAQAEMQELLSELPGDSAAAIARQRRARLEAAILRTMPPDSVIALEDLNVATRAFYPEEGGTVFGDGMFEGMNRSEAVQRIEEGRTRREQEAGLVDFLRSAIGYVPTVLFLILPLFALLLKLVYVRRGWFYSEHLVFGLHTHAVAFVVFSLVALVALVEADWTDWVVVVLLLTIPLYFLLAMKRVYRQGWIKTLVKATLLGVIYNVVLISGVVGVILLAAALG